MKDLEVARTVQENLFPQIPLKFGDFQIFGKSCAMTDIGGDYFDYFPLSETEFLGIIGDVSGHGVSAALIMGIAKGFLTDKFNQGMPLGEILGKFNTFLLKEIKRKKMLTLLVFVVNTETSSIRFANAGHNYPFYHQKRGKKTSMLPFESSMPLGVSKKGRTSEFVQTLQPGDFILLYTDGLVEAEASTGEQIGYERLPKMIEKYRELSPEEITQGIFADYENLLAGKMPKDDVTIVCLKLEK